MNRRGFLKTTATGLASAGWWVNAAHSAEMARISATVRDEETKDQIPCTVTIRASTGSVILENPSFRGGFRSNGRFEKVVPPGETTVTISRGFDYVAEERKIDLQPGQQVDLSLGLRRRANLRQAGWYCGDNHDHMKHDYAGSKVLIDFAYVALTARAVGLDYMSIAQMWNLSLATPKRLTAACEKVSKGDMILTWNMEMPKNYWRGDVSHCLGHAWTLAMRGYTPDGRDAIQELFAMSAHDYESEKTPAPNFESQALIHGLGGLSAYTHPCRWWRGKWGGEGIYPVEVEKFVSNLAQELPYDTIVGPTYDTMDIMMQPGEKVPNEQAEGLWFTLLNKGYHIPGTGSSDAAFDNIGGGVPGRVRVYTRLDGPLSIGRIAKAMKAGRNFVTSGPLLLLEIGENKIGDVVPVSQPLRQEGKVRAWASGAIGEYLTKVEIVRNGEIIKTYPIDSRKTDFEATFEVLESKTAWYIARCWGSTAKQVAITNPIYFEGSDYKPPEPTPAHVTGIVTDSSGRPLDGECDVIRMVGLKAVLVSKHQFSNGGFSLDVPGTARLRVRVRGYTPMMKSVFMDYQPLLQMTLNLREAEVTDWRTFEEIKELLKSVHLEFQLVRSEDEP